MSYQGHCNCESIRLALPRQPPSSTVCHWYEPGIYYLDGCILKWISNTAIVASEQVVVVSTLAKTKQQCIFFLQHPSIICQLLCQWRWIDRQRSKCDLEGVWGQEVCQWQCCEGKSVAPLSISIHLLFVAFERKTNPTRNIALFLFWLWQVCGMIQLQ